jgi:hypothetical protein
MTTRSSLTGMARPSMTADSGNRTRIRGGLFAPVLGPLMQSRWIIALLATLTVVQVALTAAGTIAWQCPLKSTIGVICPGCGLTRALVLFAQGHWKAAFDLHAFAPVFIGIGIFLVIGSILPAGLQHKIAYRIAAFERRTAIVALLILSILAYWILRITNLI